MPVDDKEQFPLSKIASRIVIDSIGKYNISIKYTVVGSSDYADNIQMILNIYVDEMHTGKLADCNCEGKEVI